jgi:hypothetical protein
MRIHKYTVALCLAFSLLALGACAPASSTPAAAAADLQRAQLYYLLSGGRLCASEDRYFYIDEGMEFVRTVQKGETQSAVLCNKPDCLHDQEMDLPRRYDCNGYLFGALYITYADGAIYASAPTDSGPRGIIRCAADGSGQEVVYQVEHFPDRVTVSGGYAYIAYTMAYDPAPKDIYGLIRVDLNGKKEEKTIFEAEGDVHCVFLNAAEDRVMMGFYSAASMPPGFSLDIDLKTQAQSIYETTSAPIMYLYERQFSKTLPEGLSYQAWAHTSGAIDYFADKGWYVSFAMNDQYIFYDTAERLENERYIIVMDHSFQELNRIPFTRAGRSALLGADADYLIYQEYTQGDATVVIKYIAMQDAARPGVTGIATN